MSIAKVAGQEATGTSGGTASMTLTLASAPTPGDLLTVCITGGVTNDSTNLPTMTNVTFTKLIGPNTTRNAEIYIGVVGSSPGTVCTVTASVAHSYRGNICEWSAATNVGAAGVAATFASTNAPSTGSITPTASVNALLIAVCSASTGAGGTPTNGFTALATANSLHQYSYRIDASTSGSTSTAWTYTLTPSGDTLIAVIYASTGGSRPLFRPTDMSGLGAGGAFFHNPLT